MPAADPAERSMVARVAALTRWAHETDRSGATAPARRAMLERFERDVDPDGVLDPVERAVRADDLRRAHFQRLALRSVQSRRRAAKLLDEALAAEVEIAAVEDTPQQGAA